MADSDIPISERRPVSLVGEPQAALAGDRPRLARFATEAVVRRQRRVWSLRAASWDQHGSAGLGKVTAAVLDAAAVRPAEVVVEIGRAHV